MIELFTKIGIFSLIPLSIVTLLYFFQDRMIYYPRQYDSNYESILAAVEKIDYETGSGKETAFFVNSKSNMDKPPDKIWLLFGGNASLALDWYFFVNNFGNQEDGFLLIDYPGYGFNKGKASPKTIEQSSNKAYQHFVKQYGLSSKNSPTKIGVIGHSLGAAAALLFARENKINKLILISPFTSLKDMAKKVVGSPLNNLVAQNYDNKAALKKIIKEQPEAKISIFHGDQDEVVPFHMGKELADLFPEKISFYPIENSSHNMIISQAEEKIFQVMKDL